jgi:hypothetical protein
MCVTRFTRSTCFFEKVTSLPRSVISDSLKRIVEAFYCSHQTARQIGESDCVGLGISLPRSVISDSLKRIVEAFYCSHQTARQIGESDCVGLGMKFGSKKNVRHRHELGIVGR